MLVAFWSLFTRCTSTEAMLPSKSSRPWGSNTQCGLLSSGGKGWGLGGGGGKGWGKGLGGKGWEERVGGKGLGGKGWEERVGGKGLGGIPSNSFFSRILFQKSLTDRLIKSASEMT